MKGTLVLFTIDYPDPLLDKELPFLAEAFDTVYLLPDTLSGPVNAPKNVRVISLFQKVNLRYPFRLIVRHFFTICRIYGWMILNSPYRRYYLKYSKSFLGHLFNEAEKIKILKEFIARENLHHAIFYDYWLVDSTLALAELKRKKIIHHTIARAHGFDLYHERQFEKHVPYQDYRVKYLDAVYTISRHGYNYLKSKLSQQLAQKVRLSYLGITNDYPKILSKRGVSKFLVVSCARLIPLKRIDLLVEVLKLSSLPVHWVHLGHGPEHGLINEKCKTLPSNISVELLGEVNNEEVMVFYSNHYVDLFVSLSRSEGLPVSMMEAISFGIPVMACSVNGVPEIVTTQTGILVDVKASAFEIKEILEDTLLNQRFDRERICEFFRRNFNARDNITTFIDDIRKVTGLMVNATKTSYRQCVRCVLDNEDDPEIFFDDAGICNYCRKYEDDEKMFVKNGDEAKSELHRIVNQIKKAGARKSYDCILGISGGVDSTYLAYRAKQLGLRPLLVHFDNGWNSELAVKNIENIVSRLGFDLHTFVVDWEEFKSLQLAFLKASVIDVELPTDHAMLATLYQLALKQNIRYILSGHNVVSESVLPIRWYFNKRDHIHIKAINHLFGEVPLKTFPLLSSRLKFLVEYKGIKSVALLNYMPYNKQKVKQLIIKELGWRDYGGKHYESVFTRFYQGYILIKKFGIDKRKAHLSNLICSGQMTREEVIQELKKPAYELALFETDYEFVLKKLQLTREEFEGIMSIPPKNHVSYPVDKPIYDRFFFLRLLRPFWLAFKKVRTRLNEN